ncbi:unnamed protein product [Protopolystoma xenopodis]|uniref:Uncharacterized protein n=1 Tax=Protopolystoma xenopodis TaxID=117903 RepID=A0A448WRC6_9PLAT|nr:unnamed protein product [Protopolystoma xenopodis]
MSNVEATEYAASLDSYRAMPHNKNEKCFYSSDMAVAWYDDKHPLELDDVELEVTKHARKRKTKLETIVVVLIVCFIFIILGTATAVGLLFWNGLLHCKFNFGGRFTADLLQLPTFAVVTAWLCLFFNTYHVGGVILIPNFMHAMDIHFKESNVAKLG